MLTTTTLQEAFKIYLDEIKSCLNHKCYFAMLHLIVVLPDICGALESVDGKAKMECYKDWCERYLKNHRISSGEWYEIRCKLLHEGRTATSWGTSSYKGFGFLHPGLKDGNAHGEVVDGFLHLDVREIADDMKNALDGWFKFLEDNPASEASKNVEANLRALVCETPPQRIEQNGVILNVATVTKTSSLP